MQLGLIGLGRMGSGMTRRLMKGGHQLVVYDRSSEAVAAIAGDGAVGASSLEDLGQKLKPPRIFWLMIPAGPPVDDTIQRLSGVLSPGDVIVVGGNQAVFKQVEPILKTLAPADGYAYVGPSGAGHYAKMVHNGIEYSMLQSYAEGFEILKAAPFNFDLVQLARLWNHGSVIRSWLLELAQAAFERDPQLAHIKGYVEGSGEGRWTLEEALAHAVPAPALAMSLFMRYRSRQEDSFSAKVLAALRNEFGGHPVRAE